MPMTLEEAYIAAKDAFTTGWNAGAAAIVGSVPPIRYTGVETGDIPDSHFTRFTFQPVLERQATLRNGELGQRYESEGLIIVQVFTWRKEARALEFGRKLGSMSKNIYRGKDLGCGFLFRNVRVNYLDPEPKYLRWNMIAEYQFDEIG